MLKWISSAPFGAKGKIFTQQRQKPLEMIVTDEPAYALLSKRLIDEHKAHLGLTRDIGDGL